MTIPRIEVKEDDPVCTVLHCTGCDQDFYYADYLTQDPQEFLAQCVQDATEHECFLAGRIGYIVNPSEDALVTPHPEVVVSGDSPGVRADTAAAVVLGYNTRDSEGRCLTCLRFGEKQELIRRAQDTNDKTERAVLLERARTL
ncbi:hypothetical protein LCGC14_1278560 [marine sediment metagenome]|uniref:Uncharacterized protein n=1 Tax=marine sediment metagenome TaxID=412755 RepID=A0A0F9NCL2_9ZZZZ